MIGVEMDNNDYHASKALGSTTLKAYKKNAVKAYGSWNGDIEQKSSQAFLLGSLIHTFALEPDEFDKEYMIVDKSHKLPSEEHIHNELPVVVFPDKFLTPSGGLSSTKANKDLIQEFRANHPESLILVPNEKRTLDHYNIYKHLTIVTQEDVDFAKVVAHKALTYEFQITVNREKIYFYLDDAKNSDSAIFERAFFAFYNEDGTITKEPVDDKSIELKTKPDIMLKVGEDTYIVIDLKSADDASPESFRKGGGLFYHLQETHYTKVIEANGINVYKFLFLFVGKQEWSTAQSYEYDQPSKELGDKHFHEAMLQHRKALNGEVRETVFANGEYDREPIIGLPAYMHYLD